MWAMKKSALTKKYITMPLVFSDGEGGFMTSSQTLRRACSVVKTGLYV
jgi:hypothetical protein